MPDEPRSGVLHERSLAAILLAALLLLPFAEWRGIILPVNGKDFGIDPAGQASVSPFDLVFLLFCLAILPAGVRFLRDALSPRLAHWLAALALLALLLSTNEFVTVFLTPAVRKVVDARSLLIHMAVMAAVAVYVTRLRVEALIRAMFVFCAASAVVLSILSYLALTEFPYFRLYYPFQSPTHIAFPFPNYNVAAPFITITCLGFVGSAFYLRRYSAIVLALPVFVLAAALTGSRSNLFVLVGALALLACMLAFFPGERGRRLLAARSVAWVSGIAALLVGLTLVAGHDWQPVQRAVSIFGDIAADPAVLLRGHQGSPRKVMWDLARSKIDLSALDDNRNFDLILTAIHDGCVLNSKPIKNLSPGRDYWVRLIQDTGANLEVYADQRATALVGETTLGALPRRPLPHLFMYLADSGRRYVIQSGSVGNFRLDIDGSAMPAEVVMPSRGVSYFDPLNGSPGAPVAARGAEVIVEAKDRKIRGFVASTAKLPPSEELLVLEYWLRLERVTHTLPLDAPVMFYVGLSDAAVTSEEEGWTRIRNGLLVQHRRQSSPWEMGLFAHADVERIWEEFPYSTARERRAQYERLQRERRCGVAGAQTVKQIWTALETYDVGNLTFENIFGGRLAAGSDGIFGTTFVRRTRSAGSDISLYPDETWSSERHLKYGGSTHNLYLDWYYYEGRAALVLWLLFAASFLASLAACVWRWRNSKAGAFLLAVALQVAVIFLLMYAHPYIWIKYYWVVFGIASGLLVHDELSGRADARAAP